MRDPRGAYILIVPPIIQMVVFSVAATQEVKNVRVAVLNEDYGTAGRDLIARFEGSTNFAQVHYLRGEADIAPAIDSRSVLMVVHVGPDFSRRLEGGMPADVQLILDGRRSNAAQIVAGYASAIMEGFDRELAAHAPHAAIAERRGRAGLVQPQPGNHLEHGARAGGGSHNPDGSGHDCALRGP